MKRRTRTSAMGLCSVVSVSRYDAHMAPEDTATVTQDDVYDVEVKEADVYVTFTLTYPGCPIGPQVSEQMKEFVGEMDGVEGVYPKMVFDPPWSPDMMSEDA